MVDEEFADGGEVAGNGGFDFGAALVGDGYEGAAAIGGLTWNTALDTGGVLVSEKLTLEVEISAVRSEG